MTRAESPIVRYLPDYLAATPVRTGLSLGLALVVFDRLVPFDAATVGVLLLALGAVLALEGEDWWSAAGRMLAATGGLLVAALVVVP